MKILGYRVNILTGPFTKLELKESKDFFNSSLVISEESLLKKRKEAHSYALEIQSLLQEAIEDNSITLSTKNLLEAGVETFATLVEFVVENDEGEEEEFTINGDFVQLMIPNWEEEANIFIENELTNTLYSLDCTSYGYGSISVLKETYEMWSQDFTN